MSFGDDNLDDGTIVERRRSRRSKSTQRDTASAPAPRIEDCPVKPRGKLGKLFVFATPYGDIECVSARELATPAGLAALFDGDTSWLREFFPALDKPGGYVAIAAATWLINVCRAKGYFDPDRDVRGPGAWRLFDGSLLLHLGSELEIRRPTRSGVERLRSGTDYGGHFYYSARAEPHPAPVPATASEAGELFEFLHRWRFGHAEDPRVILGWIGCAYLAGALRWRPHIWVSGDTATGKSTLELLLRALLGSSALRMADTTKAAVAQKLRGAARPVLIDELERDVDPLRQKSIVELARLASTEGQGELSRGSPEGVVRSYAIRACFYLSGIVPAPLSPQDRSRIHMIDLNTLARASVDDIRFVKETVTRLGAELPAKLRARAVDGFWRFQKNEHAFEEAIAAAWLRGGRVVDQIGTLLAMSEMLLRDDPITVEQARGVLLNFESRREDILGRDDDAEPNQCSEHLVTASITTGGRMSFTIAELVEDVRRQTDTGQGRRIVWDGAQHLELRRRGLAVAFMGETGELGLAIANRHGGLSTIFEGTRWGGGAWVAILRRIQGAYATEGPVRFAGFRGRATIVPLAALPLSLGPVDDTVEASARVASDPADQT